jgi:hypothetical protein
LRRHAIIGICVAVAIGAATEAYNAKISIEDREAIPGLQARLTTLRDQCLAESRKEQQDVAMKPNVLRDSPWLGDPLVCDPQALASGSEYRTGSRVDSALEVLSPNYDQAKGHNIQTALARTQTALDQHQQSNALVWPYAVSLFVLLITVALPWAWYFLLARVRELGDAVRGR